MLNVIILHCHFDRSGVTQVVENHVRSLHQSADVQRIVLVGGNRAGGLSEATCAATQRIEIDDFDYDEPLRPSLSARDRGQQIATRVETQLAAAGIQRDESVLHWHNHSLGKNTAAPAAIVAMAEAGWRLLLQIHDFVEDNRPKNYLQIIEAAGAKNSKALDAYLYPCAAQIHYAGLTWADASVIASLGIPKEQTHCLPNSVAAPSAATVDRDSALEKVRRAFDLSAHARWALYPVRGIRRKNVGEFLLLSRLMADEMFAALTLCPTTPVEKRSYDRWKLLAATLAPRAVFDAAHHKSISYAENLAASDYVISTSVAEGFGMAFLEPWLSKRRVIARRLPSVTEDFESAGVDLSQLYDQIPVPGPVAWLNDCRREIQQAFSDAWSIVPPSFRPCFDQHPDHNRAHIDFARLTTGRQIEVLQRMVADGAFDRDVKACSARLVDNLQDTADKNHALINHNADVVRAEYAVEKQAEALMTIYRNLLRAKPASRVDSPSCDQPAINLVSRVRPFFPCRTETLDE